MFITQGKTNWIPIIVVALIAGAVGGALTVYINDTIRQTDSLSQSAVLQKPDKNQKTTNTQININNQPVGWKTCVNKNNGFSVAYPAEFEVDPTTCDYGNLDYNKLKDIKVSNSMDDFRQNWLFSITAEKTSSVIDQWVKNQCAESPSCSKPFAGPIADSQQYDFLGVHYAETDTVVENNGTIFDFSLNARNPNVSPSAAIRGVYNQIISTFKVVEAQLTADFAGWLTLQDKWHGISLKYPQNFGNGTNLSSVVWPPSIIVYPASQAGCPAWGDIDPDTAPDRTVTINGIDYTVYETYAPDTYKKETRYYYCFSAPLGQDKRYALLFELNFANCLVPIPQTLPNVSPQCTTAELDEADQRLQAIVQTVKLGEPQQDPVGTRPGWRIYKDNELGFQMEYPEGSYFNDLRFIQPADAGGNVDTLEFTFPLGINDLKFKIPVKMIINSDIAPYYDASHYSNNNSWEKTDWTADGITFTKFVPPTANVEDIFGGNQFQVVYYINRDNLHLEFMLEEYFNQSDLKSVKPNETEIFKQFDQLVKDLKIQVID